METAKLKRFAQSARRSLIEQVGTKLKRVLAEQLSDQTELLETLAGEDGSTLITVRNERALEVLREQLDDGARDIAIFYGAGHMPDLEKRLAEDFNMRRVSNEWIEAWDLR